MREILSEPVFPQAYGTGAGAVKLAPIPDGTLARRARVPSPHPGQMPAPHFTENTEISVLSVPP